MGLKRIVCLTVAAFAMWCILATPTLAQGESEPAVTVGVDVAFNSRYMFWGLTLSNKPVWQPDIWLSTHGLTFTVWANNEFEKDAGGSDYTSGGSRSGNTEIDYSLDYTFQLGGAETTLGVVQWTYNDDNTGVLGPYSPEDLPPGFENGPDLDSTELYALFTWGDAFLAPNISLYYDIDLYRGLFGWVSISQDLPLGSRSLTFTELVGFSYGMSNTGSKDLPLYAEEGVNYVDISASMDFELGSVTLSPNVHYQYNIDEFTKTTSATEFDDKSVITFGATLAWSKDFGGN